ncbi:MAG: glucose-1-phosphate thymidylyltransferase RfbA [Candidatus Omnitrophica bacterium]|nr:glucose-1-phosphate thymidylyltransferase RfbA [Candidatus Omnitrophota bacterium]
MANVKGIILAGGKATRLYPITKSISKQLLPVYDKPMIYYPLSVLMLSGIKDILIITTSEALAMFQNLLGDGKWLGINISYAIQDSPKGLADAFIVGERFIGDSKVCLILGDNIFFGERLQQILQRAILHKDATIFAYYVKDPERYGVVELNAKNKAVSIEEKPKSPKSNFVVTGLYYFDNNVVEIAKKVKPSARGELEITDVINAYLRKKRLNVETLGRGYAWLDTGTYDSLLSAASFIKTIEERTGLKIACIEEIAYKMKFINKKQILAMADQLKTSYGDYLRMVAGEN